LKHYREVPKSSNPIYLWLISLCCCCIVCGLFLLLNFYYFIQLNETSLPGKTFIGVALLLMHAFDHSIVPLIMMACSVWICNLVCFLFVLYSCTETLKCCTVGAFCCFWLWKRGDPHVKKKCILSRF
jgi:hypothetical protein